MGNSLTGTIKTYCSFNCSVNILWNLTWQNDHVSDDKVLIVFFSPSKLRSGHPTKELHTIKCRRMRIITSLLFSVESPAPSLPAIYTLNTLARESVRK